jgi:hypothetical protein
VPSVCRYEQIYPHHIFITDLRSFNKRTFHESILIVPTFKNRLIAFTLTLSIKETQFSMNLSIFCAFPSSSASVASEYETRSEPRRCHDNETAKSVFSQSTFSKKSHIRRLREKISNSNDEISVISSSASTVKAGTSSPPRKKKEKPKSVYAKSVVSAPTEVCSVASSGRRREMTLFWRRTETSTLSRAAIQVTEAEHDVPITKPRSKKHVSLTMKRFLSEQALKESRLEMSVGTRARASTYGTDASGSLAEF